ncbi:MAG TPA: carboxypeptidase-like regulatory domain-containing protein [Flavobacteriaceae bacterium]|nr:carboxypeptidase-like regulatory domain-containing protein [Flavobacteriaceae bacterium]
MKPYSFLTAILLLTGISLYGQTATLQGIVFDENQNPIPEVEVYYMDEGTVTNENGFYDLKIPADQQVQVNFSYIGLSPMQINVRLKGGETREFNPVLKDNLEQISTVIITGDRRSPVEGITSISPNVVRKIPGANAGVENLLKTLPGVSSNNELSTQYSVRGGNYDENLVYVNGIEVYRPQLIRSGQQEGLSFVNTDLVRNVDFSAGGFQAKYGDKLSSVLDIEYKRPVELEGSLELSMLGGSASIGGASKNGKFTGIGGIRYRDHSLLVDSKDTETDFKPVFADAQTYLTYEFSDKFELGFLGTVSLNKYDYKPIVKETTFGTIDDPTTLFIYYDGKEVDQYETYSAALKASYKVSDNYTAQLIGSVYNSQEEENYDLQAEYRLGKPNTSIGSEDLGKVDFTRGVGGQLDHARNALDGLYVNLQHLGKLEYGKHIIDYGVKYAHEDIKDRVREYQVIDSAGYSIRPPLSGIGNHQPYEPFEGEIVPYTSTRAENHTKINRLENFLQWSYNTHINDHKFWINAGVRSHTWNVSGEGISSTTQTVFSPRGQLAIKPDWEADMVWRLSGGLYTQPPFYRELRDSTGTVRPEVKAQKAIHAVLSNDYSFEMADRPFKLVSEAYYKKLTDVNPYSLENVRIRYRAHNDATAYAYGVDFRLNGELVKGTESWVSVGYLRTEENIRNRGYISRPTDQRLKFAVMFQDYVPNIPRLRLYINGVYNTGLPGGSPDYADPYNYQTRLSDYQRFDIGFSYVFVDEENPVASNNWAVVFRELVIGAEVFNMFDRQNSITNTFVRDVESNSIYSVPNYLTTRVFNLRLGMKF